MSTYIHGSAPEEQARLARLNQLINDRCFTYLCVEPGHSVLDVGSGLGQFTLMMGRAAGPAGMVLGIERDPNQRSLAQSNLDDAGVSNVSFRQGDAMDLQLAESEWNSFDIVHARFVLEHLPNPARCVGEMVRAAKPGGRIILSDDDHVNMVLYPEPRGFQEVWQAYMDSYIEIGNDPYIGRKLHRLLHDHGVRNIRNNTVFFGDCASTETFHWSVVNIIGILQTARPVILEAGLMTERAFDDAVAALNDWGQLPYAAIWYSILVASGEK